MTIYRGSSQNGNSIHTLPIHSVSQLVCVRKKEKRIEQKISTNKNREKIQNSIHITYSEFGNGAANKILPEKLEPCVEIGLIYIYIYIKIKRSEVEIEETEVSQ